VSEEIRYDELAIGETFIFPYDPTEYAYRKESEKHSVSLKQTQWGLFRRDVYPQGAVMRVEADAEGKALLLPPYDHIPVEEWGKVKLPPNWSQYGKRISWKGAKLTIKGASSTRATKTSVVVLDDGEWPSDRELMMLIDGRVPTLEGHPGHFGGGVGIDGNKAIVTIYTD